MSPLKILQNDYYVQKNPQKESLTWKMANDTVSASWKSQQSPPEIAVSGNSSDLSYTSENPVTLPALKVKLGPKRLGRRR